jgi:AbrB family looped-hinge helix DNA binding protein
MGPATSRVTSQNQISIPAEVRKRFGIKAGTEVIWEEKDGELHVRPKRFTLEDVQSALGEPPSGARTLRQLHDGKVAAATRKTSGGGGR